jgi:hypothetical protein
LILIEGCAFVHISEDSVEDALRVGVVPTVEMHNDILVFHHFGKVQFHIVGDEKYRIFGIIGDALI